MRSEESTRLDHLNGIAKTIVKEGWFTPSVRTEPGDAGSLIRARWLPFWAEPRLTDRLRAPIGPGDRDAIATLVDRTVRERLTPDLKTESFRSLHPRYGVPHTPLEKWVYGLLYDEVEPREVADWLADDVEDWHRELERDIEAAPYRVAFVLLEPDAADGLWQLVPGLQATDEERLFVPASEVWACTEPDLRFEGRVFEAAQERLSVGLALASGRFAPIARARVDDAGVELIEAEAVDFLETGAAMLESAGLGAVLPTWWDAPSPLEVSVRYQSLPGRGVSHSAADTLEPMAPLGGSAIGFDTLMAFHKELLLHGAPISETDWRRLAERDATILYHGGRWLRLRDRDRRSGTRFFREAPAGEVTVAEAMRTVLSFKAGDGINDPLAIRRWSGDGELERVVTGLRSAGASALLPAPEELQGELRDYQQRGYSWLVRMREFGFGACLADDMGLGKTVQWIAYALYVLHKNDPEKRRPFLLICPTSVLGNWQRELERFAPSLRVHFHYGTDRVKGDKFRQIAASHDILLTSYSTALRDRRSIGGVFWDAVTLDEAQYVKNSGAQLTRFVRTLPSSHRIAMTGTPVENRLSDLWSIFEFINPGYLGSERSFRKAFGEGAERQDDPTPAARLHLLIQPFLLRRMKTDERVIRDLPDKVEHQAYCGLTERQASLYTAALERMQEQLRQADGMRRRGVILSTITKLKQICNAPEHALRERTLRPGSSGKLIRLEELLRESLSAKGRCIVFTQYASMAVLLQPYLAGALGCEVGMMIGQTPRKEREHLVVRFQEDADGPPVLVLSLKTGGFGLNLTRANLLVHYDRWWNPAAERQATDRAYRIGQTRTVDVWKLITQGTLEEAIEKLLERKERLAEDVVGTGEQWITEYSDEQLSELLSLRKQIILEEER
jgi:hypothetical protein